MSKFRPMSAWDRFCAAELPFELALAFAAVAGPAAAGARFLMSEPKSPVLAWLCFGGAAVGGIALFLRAISRNRRANNAGELHALDGILHTLHSQVLGHTSNPDLAGLRACIFVPTDNPDRVHQITNYVGVDKPYGKGRELSSRCGVVGRAFRSGVAYYDKLPNSSVLTDHLVVAHGFDRVEAAQMKQDRRSWAAVPVGEPEAVVAVIYMDSALSDIFGNGNSPKRRFLEAATTGVAKFIASN